MKWLRDCVIVLSVVVVGLAGLELALRLAFPDKAPKTGDLMGHDHYIVALRPGWDGWYERNAADGGDRIHYRINEFGFRGGAIPDGAQPDVMVFGDSNVQAVFSTEEATFAAQLGEQLSQAVGQPVLTVNAGVKGYGPDQSLARMRDELGRWHPKTIVVVLFAENDYGDLMRNRLFKVEDGKTLVAYESSGDPGATWEFGTWLAEAASETMLGKVAKRIGNAIAGPPDKPDRARYVAALLRRSQDEYENYIDPFGEVWGGDHYDFDIALMPDSDSSRVKRQLMDATIKEIAALAKAHEVDNLIFLVLPSRVDASMNDPINYQYLSSAHDNYRRYALTAPIKTTLEENNLHYIDLSEYFMADDKSPYYLADGHWNDAGQALAAELVASYMLKHFPHMAAPTTMGQSDSSSNQDSGRYNTDPAPAHE